MTANNISHKTPQETQKLSNDDLIYILKNIPEETLKGILSGISTPSKDIIDNFDSKTNNEIAKLKNTNQDENNLNKDAKKLAADLEIEKRVTTLETQGGVTSKLTELFNLSLLVSILGLFISYMFVLPNYQIEYNKQISELKNEYNSKVLEQQNTINLQQEKIQNIEDDIKELKDIIKKIFY